MQSKLIPLCVFISLIFSSCSRDAEAKAEFKSMEQIQKENGIPVVIREAAPEIFTASMKYSVTFKARSETTATAKIADVVRNISVKMGDPVQKDQIIMTFSEDNPSYQQAKANYENAEAVYKRTQFLFESKGISQQALDNAKTGHDVAKSVFKAQDDIIKVKAPIAGFITRLDVQVTDNVNPGDVLFTVSNLDKIEGRVWVSASEIGLVKEGSPVSAVWLGRTYTGKITQVNMIMDSEKKAFLVLTEFPNPEHLLTSGITTDISIQTYMNKKALVVQRKDLIREGDDYFAFVAASETAEKRKLTIGKTHGLSLEITDGLKPGDLLISEGSQQVKEGSKITVVRVESRVAGAQ